MTDGLESSHLMQELDYHECVLIVHSSTRCWTTYDR